MRGLFWHTESKGTKWKRDPSWLRGSRTVFTVQSLVLQFEQSYINTSGLRCTYLVSISPSEITRYWPLVRCLNLTPFEPAVEDYHYKTIDQEHLWHLARSLLCLGFQTREPKDYWHSSYEIPFRWEGTNALPNRSYVSDLSCKVLVLLLPCPTSYSSPKDEDRFRADGGVDSMLSNPWNSEWYTIRVSPAYGYCTISIHHHHTKGFPKGVP